MILVPLQIFSGDKTEKKEIGVACSTYGDRRDTGLWWGKFMEWEHVEDAGVDGRIILIWILEK